MKGLAHEREWAQLMVAAIDGNGEAYHELLEAMAAKLRGMARRGLARAGVGWADAEDVVQETLLAIHLKRHTWRQDEPIGPWIAAIARNKLIDAMRRRGRRAEVGIDDHLESLATNDPEVGVSDRDIERMLARLTPGQRDVVRAVSLEGASIRETAARFDMSEGAVRVSLHRALKAIAVLYRRSPE